MCGASHRASRERCDAKSNEGMVHRSHTCSQIIPLRFSGLLPRLNDVRLRHKADCEYVSRYELHPRLPPNAAVLVDETLPSRLGTLSACNFRIAIGTGIARFDFYLIFN